MADSCSLLQTSCIPSTTIENKRFSFYFEAKEHKIEWLNILIISSCPNIKFVEPCRYFSKSGESCARRFRSCTWLPSSSEQRDLNTCVETSVLRMTSFLFLLLSWRIFYFRHGHGSLHNNNYDDDDNDFQICLLPEQRLIITERLSLFSGHFCFGVSYSM